MTVKMQSLMPAAIRISMIMMGAEILITFMMQTFPNRMNIYEIAIIDAIALVLLSVIPISIYVIRPFLDAKAQAQLQIHKLSVTDPLTQLPNRRLVVEHLDRVVAGCTRHNEYCAVLVINLDNFRMINERYGYDTGDAVLIEVARRLHSIVRAEDIVGRIGGDEFAVLLERLQTDTDTTGERVKQIANKLVTTIDMPMAVKSKSLHISASVGIRLLGDGVIDTNAAMTEADNAMYRAKEAGGRRAEIF